MFGWLRGRDTAVYPADEIGDALHEAFPNSRRLPATVALRYEIYFARAEDAEAMARHLEDRSLAFIRDHEADTGGGIPSWDITVDCPVKARHLELKMAHAEMLRHAHETNGKLGTWQITALEA